MSLIEALSTTDALADVFSDASVLQAMLDFEVALARVQARAGVIPESAAAAIADAARVDGLDAAAIASAARASATLSIPLVDTLAERVRAADPGSAAFVHWGATSQDVTDTALVLLLARARAVLQADQRRLEAVLRRLSGEHASTVMLGRTLLQPAVPITFGLKAAQWFASAADAWSRVDRALEECAAVQFGGAAGTLAPLGNAGLEIGRALARELGLRGALPWHTNRVRLASVVTACAVFAGTLGKIARDITLLLQPEVGELTAPGGGSSTMPHKENPAGCAIALAAAARLPGLAAGIVAALPHEHERGAGGLQAEWPIVSHAIQTAGAALAAVAATLEGAKPDAARMRANIEATRGAVFAERATFLLRRAVGRERAKAIVTAALDESRRTGVKFAEALGRDAEAARAIGPQLETIERPEDSLGSAEVIRRELLARDGA